MLSDMIHSFCKSLELHAWNLNDDRIFGAAATKAFWKTAKEDLGSKNVDHFKAERKIRPFELQWLI